VNMIQANDLKGSTPSNVTRESMFLFIRWWLLFVHKKVASIPNVARRKNPARRPLPGDGGFFSLLLELILLGVAT